MAWHYWPWRWWRCHVRQAVLPMTPSRWTVACGTSPCICPTACRLSAKISHPENAIFQKPKRTGFQFRWSSINPFGIRGRIASRFFRKFRFTLASGTRPKTDNTFITNNKIRFRFINPPSHSKKRPQASAYGL